MNQSIVNEAAAPMRSEVWRELCQSMGLLWHECGQDFSLFCYRIGYSAVTLLHTRAVELAPVSLRLEKISIRKTHACSSPSSIFSVPSTTQKD